MNAGKSDFFSHGGTSAFGSVPSRTSRQDNETKNKFIVEERKDGDDEKHDFPTRSKTSRTNRDCCVASKEKTFGRQPIIAKVKSVLPTEGLSELPAADDVL